MSIKVGDKLPDVTFRVLSAEGPKPVSTSEIFSGKKVALFAVPGAFTPTCHQKHLPSFLAHIDEFKKKGVDSIVCIAVNDPFVLGAWEDITGAKGKVLFLSDGNAEFTKRIGLGTRSKRYSMLVESGVVKAMNVEDSPAACTITAGEALLDAL